MRVIFAGTPEFARVALEQLQAAGHEIPLVLTQPDRPAGRGMKLTPSPVKQLALDLGVAIAQPRSLRLDGKRQTHEAEGMLAVCIQHEMDHLMGKVFVDYLSPLKRNRIKAKMVKQKKDEERDAAPRQR